MLSPVRIVLFLALVPSLLRAQPTARPAAWREDLSFLASTLPTKHINFFARTPRVEFERAVAGLHDAIPAMSDREIAVGMARLAALGPDAHTAIYLTTAGFRIYPLKVFWFRDGLFVTDAAPRYSEALGKRVVRIGSKTAAEIHELLRPAISAENEQWTKHMSELYIVIPEVLEALQVVANADSAPFLLEGPDGRPFSLEIAAVPTAGLRLVPARDPAPLYARDPQSYYWYHYLSESKAMYVKYNICSRAAELPAAVFGEELLRFYDNNAVEQVIFDLRNNSGGDSSVFTEIFAGFDRRALAGQLAGLRKIVVIVGRETISSGMSNALTLAANGAIVVGEPSGGKPNHFGQVGSFQLPNSRLPVYFSTRFIQTIPSGDPPSILPAIDVELASAAYFAGKDPFLDAALGASNVTSTVPLALFRRGGVSLTSTGGAQEVRTGYGRLSQVQGAAGSGQATFRYRQNGITITEATVPASNAIRSGRLFIETSDQVQTGVAFANASDQPVQIDFSISDDTGRPQGTGSLTLPARSQLARFLAEAPFNSPSALVGAMSFTASVPVSVVALRGRVNERREFLISTLPVTDTSQSIAPAISILPHFASGGGWQTQLVLLNPGETPITGRLEFFDPGLAGATAQPLPVELNKTAGSSFAYEIPAASARAYRVDSLSAAMITGSVRITPEVGAPVVHAAYSFRRNGVTITEAGISAMIPAAGGRIYADAAGEIVSGLPGSFSTGFAIANSSDREVTVTLNLYRTAGRAFVPPASMTIPARGQRALFVDQVPGWEALSTPFQGVLTVAAPSPVAITGLRGRYNERQDFIISTLPVFPPMGIAGGGDLFFPHLADGGGYLTQVVLLDTDNGVATFGNVRFLDVAGQPLKLEIR